MNRRKVFKMLMNHLVEWAKNERERGRIVSGFKVSVIGDHAEASATVRVEQSATLLIKWDCDDEGVRLRDFNFLTERV